VNPVELNLRRVPRCTCLGDPLLRLIVDVDQTEPLAVSLSPLEVVQERPNEVAPQIDTVHNGLSRCPEVSTEIADPVDVNDLALAVEEIIEGCAALGHVHGNVGELS